MVVVVGVVVVVVVVVVMVAVVVVIVLVVVAMEATNSPFGTSHAQGRGRRGREGKGRKEGGRERKVRWMQYDAMRLIVFMDCNYCIVFYCILLCFIESDCMAENNQTSINRKESF